MMSRGRRHPDGGAAVGRLGIGPIVFHNGPIGYQVGTNSTLLPCGARQVTGLRPKRVERIGTAIARELLAGGDQVLKVISIHVIRDPLSGQGFEYYAADPFLNCQMAAALVVESQRAGIGIL